MSSEYIAINRANWDSRVPAHTQGYGLEKFRADAAWLSEVVRFDQPRLGDLRGLEVLHLQCHIGTDTNSPSSICFNHGIGEILTAMFRAGLRVVAFEEHQGAPTECR